MTAAAPPDRPAPRRRGGDLGARLATAAIGIPIVFGLILLGGAPYTIAVALLLGMAVLELLGATLSPTASGESDDRARLKDGPERRATTVPAISGASRRAAATTAEPAGEASSPSRKGSRSISPLTWAAALAAALMAAAGHLDAGARLAVVTLFIMLSLGLLVARAEIAGGFQRWGAAVAGAVYVGVLGGYLVDLRLLDQGREWMLFMLFTTFATDTGAYVIGRAFGRRKLAPRVSPGKTVAGLVGGLAAGATAALALNAALGLDRAPLAVAALGLIAAAAAVLGDLAESLLKRSLGVKDMGRLFPGHGGVLDRLDSVLFVTPVVYYAAAWWL